MIQVCYCIGGLIYLRWAKDLTQRGISATKVAFGNRILMDLMERWLLLALMALCGIRGTIIEVEDQKGRVIGGAWRNLPVL